MSSKDLYSREKEIDTGPDLFAVMVTGGTDSRRLMGEYSLRSFLQQTYKNKYLIIVNHGNWEFEVPSESKSRVVQVRVPQSLTVGRMRNLAFNYMHKDAFWMSWDDDDWRHPSLVALQVGSMLGLGLNGCSIRNQVKYQVGSNAAWMHSLPVGFFGFAGAIMGRCSISERYPDTSSDEDSIFWREYIKNGMCIQIENPHHYYIRFLHGSNASKHLLKQSRISNQWCMSGDAEKYLVEILANCHIDREVIGRRLLYCKDAEIYA